MASYVLDDQHLVNEENLSFRKRQGEFVQFLSNAYFLNPSKAQDTENESEHSGALSSIAYPKITFSDDVASIAGRIAEEAVLLDQKHVQDTQPFALLEKPLLIPAMIGALLQRYLFEDYGLFVSSLTFESWASKALKMKIRLSRVWINADFRVQQLLQKASAKRLVSERNACETGVHAIKLQFRSGGPLQKLWNETAKLMGIKLKEKPFDQQKLDESFAASAQRAKDLRRAIDKLLKSKMCLRGGVASALYAAAEPELCACIVYYALSQELSALFKSTTQSKEDLAVSSQLMQYFFVGSLNVMTFNRYDTSSIESVIGTLDAVDFVASGEALAAPRKMQDVKLQEHTCYLDRVNLCSCDYVDGVLLSSSNKLHAASLPRTVPLFAQLDTTSLIYKSMFSFAGTKKDTSNFYLLHERENGCATDLNVENCEDWDNFSEPVEIALDVDDSLCSTFILSDDERKAKTLIYEKMYRLKRQKVEHN